MPASKQRGPNNLGRLYDCHEGAETLYSAHLLVACLLSSQAINTNDAKQLRKAISVAPRGKRLRLRCPYGSSSGLEVRFEGGGEIF